MTDEQMQSACPWKTQCDSEADRIAELERDLAAAQAERDELRSGLLRAIEMSEEAWSDLTYRERAMLKPTIDQWRKTVGGM